MNNGQEGGQASKISTVNSNQKIAYIKQISSFNCGEEIIFSKENRRSSFINGLSEHLPRTCSTLCHDRSKKLVIQTKLRTLF